MFLDGLSMYQWRAQVKLSKLAAAFTIICGTLLLMEDITGEVAPGAWRANPNVGLRNSYRNTRCPGAASFVRGTYTDYLANKGAHSWERSRVKNRCFY